MGQIRKCLDCGEVFMFTEGSVDKSLNNLSAGGPSVRAAVQGNVTRNDRGRYAANGTIICPYCLSTNSEATTQWDQIKSTFNRDKKKADEISFYEKKIQNMFEGLELNVDCGAQTIGQVSQDCRERIQQQITAIGGWDRVSLDAILETDRAFYRPIFIHESSSNTYYITERGKVMFTCKVIPDSKNLYRIGEGEWQEIDQAVVKYFKSSCEQIFGHSYSYYLRY